ncbi:MAG: helix-turn-helix transcriptional regulator [Oscillospiraceae bacterium]
MEKKTMGAFICVLRKANGYTQSALAEKLNVSDKAVSRWERDEAMPDLTLIPVLAEIFDVTCDELLKGGRTTACEESADTQTAKKTEKQLRLLAAGSIRAFKTRCVLGMVVAIAGVALLLLVLFLLSRNFVDEVLLIILLIGGIAIDAVIGFLIYTAHNKLAAAIYETELPDGAEDSLRADAVLTEIRYIRMALVVMVLTTLYLPFLLIMAHTGYVFPVMLCGALVFLGLPLLLKKTVFRALLGNDRADTAKLVLYTTQTAILFLAWLFDQVVYSTHYAAYVADVMVIVLILTILLPLLVKLILKIPARRILPSGFGAAFLLAVIIPILSGYALQMVFEFNRSSGNGENHTDEFYYVTTEQPLETTPFDMSTP